MTQSGHERGPFPVQVRAATMPCPSLEGGDEATRIRHVSRRRGSLAAGSARAETIFPGHRVPSQRDRECVRADDSRVSQEPERGRLR